MTIQQVLHSLVFASPKPISVGEMVGILRGAGESSETAEAQSLREVTAGQVVEALEVLRGALERAGMPYGLVEGASGWSLVTRAEYAPWVRKLYPEAKPSRLSGPALETLAIIAYRQPVTRADIEVVRGVAVDGVMQVLLDRGLVKISGRAELPGRPLLYATTSLFLEHFGLKSTEDLPNSSELRRLDLPKPPSPEEKMQKKKGRKMEGMEEGAQGSGEAVVRSGMPSVLEETLPEAQEGEQGQEPQQALDEGETPKEG